MAQDISSCYRPGIETACRHVCIAEAANPMEHCMMYSMLTGWAAQQCQAASNQRASVGSRPGHDTCTVYSINLTAHMTASRKMH